MKSLSENKRPWSVAPMRCFGDRQLTETDLRVLGALCGFTNRHGVCWPSQVTIGRHLGVDHTWVSSAVSALVKKGYLRKLKHKDYPKGIQRRSRGRTNRYQVLYKGNDPLPTLEQFWAPAARFSRDEDSDLDDALADKQSGVKGDTNKSYQVLAHTFRQAVERTCGVHRLPEPSYKTAKVLSDQGVTIEQVRDSTAAMCREALQNGRTPPSTLDQVAKWAGLCNK